MTQRSQQLSEWLRSRWVVGLGLSLALLGVGLVKYGVGLHPEWARFMNGAASFPSVYTAPLLTDGDRALLSNASLSWLAGALRLTTDTGFIALAALVTAWALILPFVSCRAKEIAFTQLAFLALVGGPLIHVLLMWIGGYDALVVLGMSIGALAKRKWLAVGGWLLAGLTHSSVAILGVGFWGLLLLAASGTRPQKSTVVRVASGAASVLVGWLTIRALTDLWGGSTDRFALFRAIPFEGILSAYWQSLPLLLFSGLGATWVMLASRPLRHLRITRVFALISVLGTLVIPLVAVDETRIIALCLAPVTLAWILEASGRLLPGDLRYLWLRFGWFAILVPVPVVWMGTPYFTSWPLAG